MYEGLMTIAKYFRLLLCASFILGTSVSQAQEFNKEKIFCGPSKSNLKIPRKAIYFIKNENEHFLLIQAIKDMVAGRRKVVLKLKHPALTAQTVLPYLCPIAVKPIIAVVEYQGWYWYGDTVIGNDKNMPKSVISGYAIKHGTGTIFKWNVW